VKIVLDTNVLMSAIFFGGALGQIIKAWRDGKIQLVVSPAIIDEYLRVAEILCDHYKSIDVQPILALLIERAIVVEDTQPPEPVCRDPDDDKFLSCAVTGKVKLIVSGDKALR
jgi:uncharacterized protein